MCVCLRVHWGWGGVRVERASRRADTWRKTGGEEQQRVKHQQMLWKRSEGPLTRFCELYTLLQRIFIKAQSKQMWVLERCQWKSGAFFILEQGHPSELAGEPPVVGGTGAQRTSKFQACPRGQLATWEVRPEHRRCFSNICRLVSHLHICPSCPQSSTECWSLEPPFLDLLVLSGGAGVRPRMGSRPGDDPGISKCTNSFLPNLTQAYAASQLYLGFLKSMQRTWNGKS